MRSFYSPLAISAPFYGYLKLLKLHRTGRSRNKDVRSGNRTQDLLHEGRALTDCAILAPGRTFTIVFVWTGSQDYVCLALRTNQITGSVEFPRTHTKHFSCCSSVLYFSLFQYAKQLEEEIEYLKVIYRFLWCQILFHNLLGCD